MTESADGGSSSESRRAVSRSEPTSTERTQAGPPCRVPTTSCAEPPPTSHTAMLSAGLSSEATAPDQASAPSSSELRIRTGAPVPRRSASANSSLFPLWRPGEVTRISIRSQPSRRARRVCACATSTASAHFAAEM